MSEAKWIYGSTQPSRWWALARERLELYGYERKLQMIYVIQWEFIISTEILKEWRDKGYTDQ